MSILTLFLKKGFALWIGAGDWHVNQRPEGPMVISLSITEILIIVYLSHWLIRSLTRTLAHSLTHFLGFKKSKNLKS